MPTARREYQHGEVSKYEHGCRCQTCLDGERDRYKQRKLRFTREGPSLTPSAPVRKMLKQLNRQGWSYTRIAGTTGLSRSALWHITSGQHPTVERKTRVAIEALWDDVYCDGEFFDTEHPDRLRGHIRRGAARWDLREIVRKLERLYGHAECLCPEDRHELMRPQLSSTRTAERMAIKHGMMPWDVWDDWDAKVRA